MTGLIKVHGPQYCVVQVYYNAVSVLYTVRFFEYVPLTGQK